MSKEDESAKTMRIDIHPDFLGESLARKKMQSGHTYVSDSPTFVSRKADLDSYSEDYQKLLQSIYDAVMVIDSKGRIIDCNMRAVDFFLCEEDDLLGSNVINLISGASKTLLKSIRNNLKDHRYTLIEAHCVRWDKSMFPAEIAVNRIDLNDEGQLCFFVRDISIRKRAQEALEEAVARLEDHDNARSQFVANVSHELRTPLTSMTYAITNMIRGVVGEIPEDMKRYLEILDGDCKRLLGTVNDILDLRKIESNTLTLNKARVPFCRLVKRSLDTLQAQIQQKFLAMNISANERKWFVNSDAQKMERVVLNIVGNAVKFTPDGGAVDVVVDVDPEMENHVLLTVSDSGIGIPPEAIKCVTERYFTVGDQPSGSGLGLAISKEIVEMHGGRIKIMSPGPGRENGTVVSVSLPTVSPPKVLVVDDEKPVLDIIANQIASQGYNVITAMDGLNALKMVEEEEPNVMVLDLVLPEIEGTEVILRMKGNKKTMRIPVIVLTAADVSHSKAQVLNSFSIPALSKPWQESELLDRIEGALLGAAALKQKKS